MTLTISNNCLEGHLANFSILHKSLVSSANNKQWIKIQPDGKFCLVQGRSQSTSLPKLIECARKILKEIEKHQDWSTEHSIQTNNGIKPYREVIRLLNEKINKYGRNWSFIKIIKRIFLRILYKKPNKIKTYEDQTARLQIKVKDLVSQINQLPCFQLTNQEKRSLAEEFCTLNEKIQVLQSYLPENSSSSLSHDDDTSFPALEENPPPPPPMENASDSPITIVSSRTSTKPLPSPSETTTSSTTPFDAASMVQAKASLRKISGFSTRSTASSTTPFDAASMVQAKAGLRKIPYSPPTQNATMHLNNTNLFSHFNLSMDTLRTYTEVTIADNEENHPEYAEEEWL